MDREVDERPRAATPGGSQRATTDEPTDPAVAEISAPDTVAPGSAALDAVSPGSTEPGASAPDTAASHAGAPDTASPDADTDDAGDAALARGGGRYRRDTLITTVVGLGTYGLSLFTGPLLARSLGTADRGSYAAVWTPTQIIGWLLMFGIPGSTAFFAHRHARRKLDATGWLVTLLIGVPVVAAVWPLVPRFLAKHPESTVGWFRAYLIAALLVLPMQNSYEYLRARQHTIRFNIYRSLSLVLTTVFIVALFVAGRLDLPSALAATWAANMAGPIVVLVAERSYPRFRRSDFDRSLVRLQASYGARSWVGLLSNMVLARFDQFLMVSIVEPSQLGIYAVAVTAAGLSAPIAQGVAFALFPHLQRDSDPAARWARTWTATKWVGLGSIVVCSVLALIGPWALPLLMGEEFRDAVAVFWVLLPGQMFWNLGQVFKTRLEADDRPGVASNTLIAAAIVTVVGVPLTVPHLGIMGAAIVTLVSQGVFCIGSFVFVWRGRRRALRPGVGREPALTDRS